MFYKSVFGVCILMYIYLFIYLFHLFTQGVPKQLAKTGFHWGPANTHE